MKTTVLGGTENKTVELHILNNRVDALTYLSLECSISMIFAFLMVICYFVSILTINDLFGSIRYSKNPHLASLGPLSPFQFYIVSRPSPLLGGPSPSPA